MGTLEKALQKFKQICSALPKISLDYAFELGYNQGIEDALEEKHGTVDICNKILISRNYKSKP